MTGDVGEAYAVSGKQARAAEELSQYDLDIIFRQGRKNPADGLLRRPDYEPAEGSYKHPEMLESLRQTLFAHADRIGTARVD